MECAKCGSKRIIKNGHRADSGKQKWLCKDCGSERNPVETKNKTMGISINDFMEKHDVHTQVRKAITKLEKGTLFTRQQFVQEFNISTSTGYKDILNEDEFKPYRGNLNADTQYFGHPEDIKMLKDKGRLKDY